MAVSIEEALTFDDVLLVPGHSEVLPRDVELTARLTPNIELRIPFISAAMDTVTEADLAIAMAQEGGLGVVHKNQGVDEQAKQVRRVKKFESGVIREPLTIHPGASVGEVMELTRAHNISGVPVVDGEDLVGIVTHRDLRFETHFDQPVSTIMTPKDRLVTAPEGTSLEVVQELLREHRIEKLLIVDPDFHLRGMVTVKDIQKSTDYPNSCKDEQGRLRVGGAVGAEAGGMERVEALVEAGADVVTLDSAHGHAEGVLQRVREIRATHPNLELIAGNVATKEGALALADAGASAVKVGVGPGSICTTRVVAGVGVPQITAIGDACAALKDREIPVIADGGIRYSGDAVKALAAGASTVMVGSLLAGTSEAPGEVELYQGRSYKLYRGMGSLGAMQHGSRERYFQGEEREASKLVPEGIEGRVPYKGPLSDVLHQLIGGVRSGMGYVGARTLGELHSHARLIRVTLAGLREGHAHDVLITKEAPNYRTEI
ncbi:MAG: IMP dehydrogenase [Gammaproteobacteria bacterium]|nr:IMP dehydrogenase [Gammaproteobacteria bacterium]